MQKKRITVTVRRDDARSVSAWGDEAIEQKAKQEDLAALLAEMKAERGPASPEDEKWARHVLGI